MSARRPPIEDRRIARGSGIFDVRKLVACRDLQRGSVHHTLAP
ncbi:hypothetical protein ACFW93_11370 [Streptomyces canus]